MRIKGFTFLHYLNCYIGHSTDYNIRYNSASGGHVTQLSIFALEVGIIDGRTRHENAKKMKTKAIYVAGVFTLFENSGFRINGGANNHKRRLQ